MIAWLVSGLLISGASLMFVAAVGVLRMPDLFTRMQASTKAGTLGAGLVLLAVAVEMRTLVVAASGVLIVSFLLLTGPVAAHIIARAAYRTGVRTWEGTEKDELEEAMNAELHEHPPDPQKEPSGDLERRRFGKG